MLNQEEIQNIIGYSFNNADLLKQAFIKKSYSQENGGQNNEVLEFIGDKVLDFIIIKIMMERYGKISQDQTKYFQTKYSEGKFTEIKKDLVQKKSLAKIVDKLHLNQYLIMGKGDIANKINEQDSVKEALLEAIIGAISLDSNWNLSLIENSLNKIFSFDKYFDEDVISEENFINIIQQWSQINCGALPTYSYSQNDEFICHLYLNGFNGYFQGKGNSKKQSRMLAAKEAFTYLKERGYLLHEMHENISSINLENSINKLQELYQKGFIEKPTYLFEKKYDENGHLTWSCECSIKGNKTFFAHSNNKTQAKKLSSYEMLLYLIDNYKNQFNIDNLKINN